MKKEKIKVTIDEDTLNMIGSIRIDKNIESFKDIYDEIDPKVIINVNELFGAGFTVDNIAFTLGIKPINATSDSKDWTMGFSYTETDQERISKVFSNVAENLDCIEEIIHQFAAKGGVTLGTYEADPTIRLWEKI